MTLASMRFDRRKWRPMQDNRGVVHSSTKLRKDELEYLFRLADMVRLLVPCGSCMAKVGEYCRRKRDGQPMSNHSYRLTYARAVVKEQFAPMFDRLYQPLCTVETGHKYVVHIVPVDGSDVNCMACLTIATMR